MADAHPTFSFGPFQLDTTERLLTRHGQPVPLTPKAFDLLVYLVDHHGRLVEKSTLMSALWPDTVVEEANLAFQISALRKALDVDGEGEALIQTVPTKGYRFAGTVTVVTNTGRRGALWPRIAVAATLALTVAAIVARAVQWGPWRPTVRVPGEATLMQLTANPAELSVTSGRISPDGRYFAYADRSGIQLRQVDTGETTRLAGTEGLNVYGWTEDGTRIRASACKDGTCHGEEIPIVGGPHHPSGVNWPEPDLIEVAPDGSRMLHLRLDGSVTVEVLAGPTSRETTSAYGFSASATLSEDLTRAFLAAPAGAGIDSVTLSDGKRVRLFSAPTDCEIVRVGPARAGRVFFIVARGHADPLRGSAADQSVWEIHTEEGVARDARRLTEWRPEELEDISVSDDASRVVFLSGTLQSDVYVADLDAGGGRMRVPRRLTTDERNDTASSWSPDSTAVMFYSFRHGNSDLFKQRIDSTEAEAVLVAAGNQEYPWVSEDGRWIIYLDGGSQKTLMRMPISGGQPAPVLGPFDGMQHCSFRGRCVVVEPTDDSTIISALDPLRGKGERLAVIEGVITGLSLSPDGNEYAFIRPGIDGASDRIEIVAFTGGRSREIEVKGARRLEFLDWTADGEGFYTTEISGHSRLLYLTLNGLARVLWEPHDLTVGWTIPSPDGHRLAINATDRKSNAWMLSIQDSIRSRKLR